MELILEGKKHKNDDNSEFYKDVEFTQSVLYETALGFEIIFVTYFKDGNVIELPIHREYGTFTLEYYQRIFNTDIGA
jgi:hypothetical protein